MVCGTEVHGTQKACVESNGLGAALRCAPRPEQLSYTGARVSSLGVFVRTHSISFRARYSQACNYWSYCFWSGVNDECISMDSKDAKCSASPDESTCPSSIESYDRCSWDTNTKKCVAKQQPE